MDRRQVLSLVGAGSVVSLSGCTGLLGEEETELVGIVIVNHSQEQETVQVRVEQGGDEVHNSTHNLDSNASESTNCTWTRDSGNFVILSRLDGDDEWAELDLNDYDSDCAYVYVNVNPRSRMIDYALSDDCEHEASC